MANTHYDHRTGEYSDFNPTTRTFVPRIVHYLDSPAPVDHQPKWADLKFQNLFSEFAFKVLGMANASSKMGFVLDEFRTRDQQPGARIVDGNFVMYLVRRDKAGLKSDFSGEFRLSDAGYRYELRAFDAIPYFDNGNVKELQRLILSELKELDEKP